MIIIIVNNFGSYHKIIIGHTIGSSSILSVPMLRSISKWKSSASYMCLLKVGQNTHFPKKSIAQCCQNSIKRILDYIPTQTEVIILRICENSLQQFAENSVYLVTVL